MTELRVPAWRFAALAGVVAATATWMGLEALAGRSPLVPLGVVPWLVAGFLGLVALRRRLTGAETTVLYEHFALAMALAVGAAWLTGVPFVDTLAAALCVLFAFGRVGCRLAGCCHGRAWSGPLARFFGVRRVPTQLAEAIVWALLAPVAGAAAVLGPPGAGWGVVLAVYAPFRMGLELVRGDARPRLAGLSEAQWFSLAALALVGWRFPPTLAGALLAGSGLVVAGALYATRGRWLRDDPVVAPTVRERAARLQAGDPPVVFEHDGLAVALSIEPGADGAMVAVSVQAPGEGAGRAAIEHLADELGGALVGETRSRGSLHVGLVLLAGAGVPPAMPGSLRADEGDADARPPRPPRPVLVPPVAASPVPDAPVADRPGAPGELPDDYFGAG